MSAVWEKPAELMLDRRDRFTRPAIEAEFNQYSQSPQFLIDNSIAFDPEHEGYLTAVADRRYSVIWYMRDKRPVVRAVVPTTRFKPGSDLKARVEEIVREVSEDQIKLL
jgi:hypothetical protein